MKKPLNILSIDWDYFVNATSDQRVMGFPDANYDLPYSLNKVIWGSRYAQNSQLANIGVTTNEFDELKCYLRKLIYNKKASKTEVMVADSHKHIYEFVANKLKSIPAGIEGVPINLFHIDYHSDYYGIHGGHDQVDCGNWLNYLWESLDEPVAYASKITWLCRWDSEQNSDLPSVVTTLKYDASMNDLEDMLMYRFNGRVPDLIFLCRSNPWSPPHLDNKFEELHKIVCKIGRTQHLLEDGLGNRWTEVESYATQIRPVIQAAKGFV